LQPRIFGAATRQEDPREVSQQETTEETTHDTIHVPPQEPQVDPRRYKRRVLATIAVKRLTLSLSATLRRGKTMEENLCTRTSLSPRARPSTPPTPRASTRTPSPRSQGIF
jgi:hypothetical protein